MSDDVSTPVPEQPGQDPDSPLAEPHGDGIGLSDSPHSGYDLGSETPAEPGSAEDASDRGEVPDARDARDG